MIPPRTNRHEPRDRINRDVARTVQLERHGGYHSAASQLSRFGNSLGVCEPAMELRRSSPLSKIAPALASPRRHWLPYAKNMTCHIQAPDTGPEKISRTGSNTLFGGDADTAGRICLGDVKRLLQRYLPTLEALCVGLSPEGSKLKVCLCCPQLRQIGPEGPGKTLKPGLLLPGRGQNVSVFDHIRGV